MIRNNQEKSVRLASTAFVRLKKTPIVRTCWKCLSRKVVHPPKSVPLYAYSFSWPHAPYVRMCVHCCAFKPFKDQKRSQEASHVNITCPNKCSRNFLCNELLPPPPPPKMSACNQWPTWINSFCKFKEFYIICKNYIPCRLKYKSNIKNIFFTKRFFLLLYFGSYTFAASALLTVRKSFFINPFLPDCKTAFSRIFTFLYTILKFLRPEHDCYAKFPSCST